MRKIENAAEAGLDIPPKSKRVPKTGFTLETILGSIPELEFCEVGQTFVVDCPEGEEGKYARSIGTILANADWLRLLGEDRQRRYEIRKNPFGPGVRLWRLK